MPRKPGPSAPPDYKPSDRVTSALAAWNRWQEEGEKLRAEVDAAIAGDLIADPDLPFSAVARHPSIPWSEMQLRNISKAHGVPPRQPNKARPSTT